MPIYIGLFNYTEQGVHDIKESAKRLDKAKSGLKAMGGELKGFYLTMGNTTSSRLLNFQTTRQQQSFF